MPSLKHFNLKSLHSFFFAPKQAFTLVELIVVISVLAVLATISFSQVGNITKNARDASRTTSISNIKGSLEIFAAQKGRYPFPDNPTTLTWAWNSKLYKGTITTAVLPWLNTDTKDPTTNSPYQYATLWNTHYQIGTNLEWTTSFNQNLTNQTFAESTNTIPYIKGNYTFDPSLPSLFPIGTSSGIFSPSTCFILESSTSPNNFSTTVNDCTPKSSLIAKDIDTSLVGYWDMETTFSSGGLDYLKDLSGNENDGVFSGGMNPNTNLTEGIFGRGAVFATWTTNHIELTNKTLTPSGSFSISFIYKIFSKLNGAAQMIIDNGNISTWSGFCFLRYYNSISLWLDIMTFWMRRDPLTDNYYSEVRLDSSYWNKKMSTNLDNFYFITLVFNPGEPSKMCINQECFTDSPSAGYDNIPVGYNFWKQKVWLGRDIRWHSQLDGIIDDLKIYNRALGSEEIAQQAKVAGF